MSSALIWGASGGIGRAIVEALVDAGWTAIALSRHPNDVSDLTPHTIEADVTDPYNVQQAMMEVSADAEAIDLWVYAAGDIAAHSVGELQPADWHRIVDANLTGAYLATQYALPLLADDAHLMYLGAIDERLRFPGLSAYAAAKAGLDAFVEAFAREQRKKRVTLLRPAAVDTALWDKVPMNTPKNALAPADVAQRIIQLYTDGETGTIDLS